jgi:hypothetical protein
MATCRIESESHGFIAETQSAQREHAWRTDLVVIEVRMKGFNTEGTEMMRSARRHCVRTSCPEFR